MKYCYRQVLPQYTAALTASLIMLSTGAYYGWLSPTIYKLKDNHNADIPLTAVQASWLAALGSLGGFAGPLAGALLANWIGRKPTILLMTVPYLLAWTLIAFAADVRYLYAARVIAGFGACASLTVTPMYLSEIATPAIRGTLGTFSIIFMHLGILLEYSTVPYVSMQNNAFIVMIIPVLLIALFIWQPESPYFLQLKNKEDEARESLKRLRAAKEDKHVEEEMMLVRTTIEKQQEDKGGFLDLVKIASNRKAMFISMGVIAAQQFSGISAITAYSHTIFKDSESKLRPEIAGIILEPLSLVSMIPCVFLIDSSGRRTLLLVSSLLTAIPHLLLGLFFYFKSEGYEFVESIAILPMVCVFAFQLFYVIGLGCIPHILIGEVFPTSVGVLASCVAEMFCSIVSFSIPKIYQTVNDSSGNYVAFWTFSTMCLMGAVFVWFYVPETKGKPFYEIQRMMKCGGEAVPSCNVPCSVNVICSKVDCGVNAHSCTCP